jgi:hypothetical protein
MRSSLLILVLTLVTAGIAGAQTTKPEVPPAQVTRWITFFDKLVAVVVADQQECDKMASDVTTLIDANRDVIAIAQRAHAAGQKLPEEAQQHMIDGIEKMVPAMQLCGHSPKVITAFKKLEVSNHR